VAKPPSYPDWLRGEFGQLVDDLDLEPPRKRFLRSRWLDQVVWTEAKAAQARNRYYGLRLTTLVGALIVPALATLDPADDTAKNAARIATWVVGLVVATSAAIEGFFHYGERWRTYRRTAELLKTEGWLYLQLSGRYSASGATHATVYPMFALRVEELIQADVDTYLTKVAAEDGEARKKKESEAGHGDRPRREEAEPAG
jgi:Protein of unknown function (DUF4231)